jgi:hypothetical protein
MANTAIINIATAQQSFLSIPLGISPTSNKSTGIYYAKCFLIDLNRAALLCDKITA